MSAVHTRGPWKILTEEADNSYIRIRGTAIGGRYKIANVLNPAYKGAPASDAEEARANASLIAAAPDLLEALQYAVKQVPELSTVPGIYAAIAKATGGAT